PEERLLRAIFGEKAADVKDASLTVPPGTEGVVMDVKVFSRKDRLSKSDDELVEEAVHLKDLQKGYKNQISVLKTEYREKLGALLLNEKAPASIIHRRTADILVQEGTVFDQETIELLEQESLVDLLMPPCDMYDVLKSLLSDYETSLQRLEVNYKTEVEHIREGDADLDHGVIRQVKVYVASKRKLQVGDKMAGRHGNKGVVSKIVPEADMPYLANGETVQMILNPLGVPSRMNLGQVLETHLGYAAKTAGIHVKTPVFEGFPESRIWDMMIEQGLPADGKSYLYDGKTGERFDNTVVIGYIYMLKLSHLIADKIHARSIGPYSLVTQQPLGGKAQMGGQRFGEMEVWALEAYGVAHMLQEILTVKSDDVTGRTRIYESIVKGENLLKSGTPESFNVLIKEMQGLGLDVRPMVVDA
ncbi:RNA polymerase Rpb2, domain 6 family protein, partial [Chlamydia psittaci 84-8471/1]